MKAALLGAACATILLIEVWANLNAVRSHLGLPEIPSAASYREPSGIAENQHSTSDKGNAELGTPPESTNAASKPTNRNADDGKNSDLPAWIQAGAAAVSLIFTGFLALKTAKQVDIAEGQRQISDRQNAIMETQTALAAESLDIAIKQKEIAGQGFLATNRPTIVMRAVTFTVGLHETDPLTIYWRLTNVGTVNAHVQSMVVNVELRDPKRRMQTILSSWDIKGGFVLDPGETREMSGVGDSPEMTNQFQRFRNEISTLLHGYVTYFSESGRVHLLGFIRSYDDDGLLGRFKAVVDPERNYSD